MLFQMRVIRFAVLTTRFDRKAEMCTCKIVLCDSQTRLETPRVIIAVRPPGVLTISRAVGIRCCVCLSRRTTERGNALVWKKNKQTSSRERNSVIFFFFLHYSEKRFRVSRPFELTAHDPQRDNKLWCWIYHETRWKTCVKINRCIQCPVYCISITVLLKQCNFHSSSVPTESGTRSGLSKRRFIFRPFSISIINHIARDYNTLVNNCDASKLVCNG